MKARLPWLLLAVFVCFNVFAVFGYMNARSVARQLRTPEGRAEWVADHLGLDAGQRERFEEIWATTRSQARQIRTSGETEADAFWAEMMKDEPDREAIDRAIRNGADAQLNRRLRGAEHVLEVMGMLSLEQRRTYVRLARTRGAVD